MVLLLLVLALGAFVAAIFVLSDHIGTVGSPVDLEHLVIRVGGAEVYGGGVFQIDREKEVQLSDYLKSQALNPRIRGYPQHQELVDIEFDFGGRGDEVRVWGSDLSDQYVRENADYRS